MGRKASSALELDLGADSRADTSGYNGGGGGQSTAGILPELSRPGSAYVLTSKHPPRPGSALSGSPLTQPGSRSGSRNERRPSGSPIDILAEGDEASETPAAPSSSGSRIGRPPLGYAGGVPPLPGLNKTATVSSSAPGALRSLGL